LMTEKPNAEHKGEEQTRAGNGNILHQNHILISQ
jgi:hypothetical protein